MVYSPKSESGKKAYILWTSGDIGAGKDIEMGPGRINPANLADMKRLYVYNEKTKLMERPFYNENLEEEYDPEKNPIPHKDLLDQNFNLEFFRDNKVYVFQDGGTIPFKVVLEEEPAPAHYAARRLEPEEARLMDSTVKAREKEVKYESAIRTSENRIGKLNSTLELYQEVYGPDRSGPDSKNKPYRSVAEQMLFRKNQEIKATNPTPEELGAMTAEQFTLLTIAALFTEEGAGNNHDRLLHHIASNTMHLDTLVRGRANYAEHEANDLAYNHAKNAAAHLAQGDPSEYHRLLAEGLNNYIAGSRSFTLHPDFLSDEMHASMPITVKYSEMLRKNPELTESLKNAGLRDDAITMIHAHANSYLLERERLKNMHDILTTSNPDVAEAKRRMQKYLTDTIMLNMFSENSTRIDDESSNKAAPGMTQIFMDRTLEGREREKKAAVINGRAKTEVAITDLEKTFADPAKVKALRTKIRNTPNICKHVTDALDKMHTMDDIRTYLSDNSTTRLVNATKNCSRHFGHNKADAFHAARKDMLSMATQMEVLLSRHSNASTEFRRLITAARAANTYPADSQALKQMIQELKDSAQNYINEKDRDFYSRMNKKLFGRDIKENRGSQHGMERYKFAKIAVKLCTQHLEELGKNIPENDYVPAGNTESKVERASASMIKTLAGQIRHQEFNPELFGRYMVLKRLEETGNSKAISNLTMYDLEEQAKVFAATDEAKMMAVVCAGKDLALHEMVDCYKAAQKYTADFKKEEGMQKEALSDIRKSILDGKSTHTHSAGHRELNEAMKDYAVQKIDSVLQKKHEQFEVEFNQFTEHVNPNNKFTTEHRHCIPEKKDRHANINSFDTDRDFYGAVALSLMIDARPQATAADLNKMLSQIHNGELEEEAGKAFTRGYNLIKYGVDADHKLKSTEIPENAGQLGREKVGELAIRTIPRMAEVMQLIAQNPEYDIAGSNFVNSDLQKISHLNMVIYNYSQELNGAYSRDASILEHCLEKMYPGNSQQKAAELGTIYDYAAMMEGIQQSVEQIPKIGRGYRNNTGANSNLAEVVCGQMARSLLKKSCQDELRNMVRDDITGPQNQARMMPLNARIGEASTLIPVKCADYHELYSVMEQLSHDRNACETVMPYIVDGSFAESLNPKSVDENTIEIRVPTSKDAVVKWAVTKKQETLKKYQKVSETNKTEYGKYAEKTADEQYKEVFRYGTASLNALYKEGMIPPSGVMAQGSRKAKMASKIMTNLLKAEFMKSKVDAKVAFADAEQQFTTMMQNPKVKAVLENPSLKELNTFVLEKGSEKLIRTHAPAAQVQAQNQQVQLQEQPRIQQPQAGQGNPIQ